MILFTGLLSVGMLGYRFQPFKWVGMLFVTLGLVVVGVTDIVYDPDFPQDATYEKCGKLLKHLARIF